MCIVQIFCNLILWQVLQLVCYLLCLYIVDYICIICDEFQELVGDCVFVDDKVIMGGLVCINGCVVMVIGYQKG